MSQSETVRLPPTNVIVKDTLQSRLPSSEKAGIAVMLSLTEFDDVRYLMTLDKDAPDIFSLSMSVPSDPSGAAGAKVRFKTFSV